MKFKSSALALAVAASTFAGSALATTDGQIKLGLIADMGGTYADVCGPGCVTAVEMAIEDFGGQALGKPIELVTADSQLKPDVASAIARQWVESENVDAITGLVSSSVTAAVQSVNNDAKALTLISTAASNSFTTKACSPYTVQWTYDVIALANGTVKPAVQSGKKKWFFITADYAFGHALEGAASKVVEANGGEVLGAVRAPLGTTDFSSYVLQAQAAGADVVGLANAGNDMVNALKAAEEFGLTQTADVAGLLVFAPNTLAMDADVAGGMRLTTGFYWDRDDQAREWSQRFEARHGAIPSMSHAGIYSMVTHYLNAVEASGTDDNDTVIAKMKSTKPDDFFSRNATLRADGRMVHDMYYVQIKPASERANSNDIYSIVETIPGDVAFSPMLPECDFSK